MGATKRADQIKPGDIVFEKLIYSVQPLAFNETKLWWSPTVGKAYPDDQLFWVSNAEPEENIINAEVEDVDDDPIARFPRRV